MAWTLSRIREKVRKLTGRYSQSELSNQELDQYINDEYHLSFPEEVKLNTNLIEFSIQTIPFQGSYALPDYITNIEYPVYINGFEIRPYVSPDLYYWQFPEYYTRKVLAVGDGTTLAFSQTSTSQRLNPGSVLVTDNVETFTDDSNGILNGSLGGTGTVDYATGAISVNFFTAPTSGTQIWVTYQQYQAGMPQALLYFQSLLYLYPIPDSVYTMNLIGYRQPDILVDSDGIPILDQWGPAIAYGAARNIFVDNGETDRYAEMTVLYKEQLTLVERRTLQDLMNQRIIPQF